MLSGRHGGPDSNQATVDSVASSGVGGSSAPRKVAEALNEMISGAVAGIRGWCGEFLHVHEAISSLHS